jgi:hypothetical protein
MAHAFKTISAKPTFGTLRENIYQSDYINRKKGAIIFCTASSRCQRIKNAPSYNTLNLYNIGRYKLSLDKCNILQVNKSNLIIGQYTKLNLKSICTVSSLLPYSSPHPDQCNSPDCNGCPNSAPITINPDKIFYEDYIIDPLGQLFGTSQCGELNYTQYMKF